MIKKFIDKLLDTATGGRRRKAASPFGKREDVPASVHGIDPELVDRRALDVVHTLKQAGHEAYIVGGAVRDLLLGLRPKDFDVATSATPEQVKGLFRRAFIIGRRFRIVHVVYGRGRDHEVIEVSTFRAYLNNADAQQVSGNERTAKGALASMTHAVDESGRVLRDNVWGPIEQDAARRDFSINAMYYDPESQTVVDFHHGIRDAKKRTLRMIGDAPTRYREDPVRIIRAVRFSAKLKALGFKLDAKTLEPMAPSLKLLGEVPQSRLFDEMLKLLQTGHSLASVEQLKAIGLGKGIYPLLDIVVERADDPFVKLALADTDRRVGEGKPVAPSFLLACVLWSDVREGWNRRLNAKVRHGQRPIPPVAALQESVDEVFDARIGDVSGRGKLGADMRDIWMMQPRFDRRTGSSCFSLADQPRFRAGFDFLRLRSQTGEVDEELAHWWESFSTADDDHRQDMIDAQRRAKPAPAASAKGGRGTKSAGKSNAKGGGGNNTKPSTAAVPDAPDAADAQDHLSDDPRFRPVDGGGDESEQGDYDTDGGDDLSDQAGTADGDGATAPTKKRRRRKRKPRTPGSRSGGEGGSSGNGGDTPPPTGDAS